MTTNKTKDFAAVIAARQAAIGEMKYYHKMMGKNNSKVTANDTQIAGDHYLKYGEFQPWDAVDAWGLGYFEGTALKYIARWKDKGGIEDLKKAIHFLQKKIEIEEAKNANTGGS